jgi:hypothetical protein
MGLRTAGIYDVMKAKDIAALALAGLLLITALWPRPLQVAPAWTIQVVDQNNRPVSGCVVQESWEHYYVDFTMHHTTLVTDAGGNANFPEQALRISWLVLQFRKVGSRLSFHGGSFTPLVYATACMHQAGLTMSRQIDFQEQPSPTRVVVRRF